MVRNAVKEDIPSVLEIYDEGKKIMRLRKNAVQWDSAYPTEGDALIDLAGESLYVMEESGEIYGVFSLIKGNDPTYEHIEGKGWLSDLPYCAVHRLAKKQGRRGVFAEAFEFWKGATDHIKADTHESNKNMLKLFKEFGFSERGVIICRDGTPRVAFEWIKKG